MPINFDVIGSAAGCRWQPAVLQVTSKLASWQLSVFSNLLPNLSPLPSQPIRRWLSGPCWTRAGHLTGSSFQLHSHWTLWQMAQSCCKRERYVGDVKCDQPMNGSVVKLWRPSLRIVKFFRFCNEMVCYTCINQKTGRILYHYASSFSHKFSLGLFQY